MSDEKDRTPTEPEESGPVDDAVDAATPSEDADGAVRADGAVDDGAPDRDDAVADGAVNRDDDAPVGRPTGKRRTPAASSRPARSSVPVEGSKRATGRATTRRAVAEAPARQNLFARITRFFREVVAELRKVIWPTRKELVTYTAVVLVFVTFMVALVSGLDILFAKGVLTVFG